MRWPTLLILGLLASALSACSDEQSSCDRLVAAMADRREECGAPRGQDEWTLGGCDGQYVMEESCRLNCWENASCEAIRGEDQAGATALRSCVDGCGP